MYSVGVAGVASVDESWTEDCTDGPELLAVALSVEMLVAVSFGILSLPPTSLGCSRYGPSFEGLIFTYAFSTPFVESVTFFVGVPNRFFLKMSLTLPPPLAVPFTSALISFFGLGDSLPDVLRPRLSLQVSFSGLRITLSAFTSGVAALLAGLLATIFFSGISIEK